MEKEKLKGYALSQIVSYPKGAVDLEEEMKKKKKMGRLDGIKLQEEKMDAAMKRSIGKKQKKRMEK
jgi:hypothetical protein